MRWLDSMNGHKFEQTPGDSKGQGSLACCSPWGCKGLDVTQKLNSTFLTASPVRCFLRQLMPSPLHSVLSSLSFIWTVSFICTNFVGLNWILRPLENGPLKVLGSSRDPWGKTVQPLKLPVAKINPTSETTNPEMPVLSHIPIQLLDFQEKEKASFGHPYDGNNS